MRDTPCAWQGKGGIEQWEKGMEDKKPRTLEQHKGAAPKVQYRSNAGAPGWRTIYFTFLRIQSSMYLMTTSLFLSRNISCMLPWIPASSRRTNSSFTPAWLSHLGMQTSNTR